MGWSCSKKANDTLDNLAQLTKMKGEKSQNTFTKNGVSFFYCVNTDKEYRDGKITGEVFKMLSDNKAVKIGGFTIAGTGGVLRFAGLPLDFKQYLNNCLTSAFVCIP
jgi:hypothetical protein